MKDGTEIAHKWLIFMLCLFKPIILLKSLKFGAFVYIGHLFSKSLLIGA